MRRRYGGVEGMILTSEELAKVGEEVRTWIEEYPWLGRPGAKAILEEAIELRLRLKKLKQWMDNPNVEDDKQGAAVYYKDMLTTWKGLMTTLGITYTAQQYVKMAEKAGTTPEEIYAELQKKRTAKEHSK